MMKMMKYNKYLKNKSTVGQIMMMRKKKIVINILKMIMNFELIL